MTLPIVPAPALPSQASNAWKVLRYQTGYGTAPGDARVNSPPTAIASRGANVKLLNRGPWPVGIGFDQDNRFNIIHTLMPGCSIAFAPTSVDLYAVIQLYPCASGRVIPGVSYFEPILATVEAISLP